MRNTCIPKKRRGQWVRPEITRLLQRREINPRQSLVLAVISNLSQSRADQGCFANNTFLAKTTMCSVGGLVNVLTQCRELGLLIDGVNTNEKRLLTCNFAKISSTKNAKRKVKYHGIWICPKLMNLLEQRVINHTQMFLLALIDNLDRYTGGRGCFASNAYLAKRLGLSVARLVHVLMDLHKMRLVNKHKVLSYEYQRTCRVLSCNLNMSKSVVTDGHLSNSHDVVLCRGKRRKRRQFRKRNIQKTTFQNVETMEGKRRSDGPYNKRDNKAEGENDKSFSQVVHSGSPGEPLVQTGGEELRFSSLGKLRHQTRPSKSINKSKSHSQPSLSNSISTNSEDKRIAPEKSKLTSQSITASQTSLSKAFKLDTTNPKDKRSIPIREIDKQRANTFHTIVCEHNILPKSADAKPRTWYKWMYKISTKFGEAYLDRVLKFLKEHGSDKYCPKPRTAMHLFRNIQEGAFDTAFAREEERNPTVTISEDAKRIAQRLHNNIWPDGTEERIPAAVQLSLNNLKEWRALLKQIPLERSERDLADHVINIIHFDNELVAVWFEELFNRIWNWPDWHGDPLREVLNPFDMDPRNRFTRQCRQVAHEYTANNGGGRWVAILEAVKDARQQV